MSFSCWMIIMAVNILVFIMETTAGGSENTFVATRFGAQSTVRVSRGEYWRLLTSMFVHFGVMHLICNMYALYNLGPTVERLFGGIGFLAIYVVAGLSGNLLTYFTEKKSGRYKLSAGASGAIFGLMGVFVALLILPQYRPYINASGVITSLIINLGYGFMNRRINMLAHLGGLIGGMAVTFLLLTVL